MRKQKRKPHIPLWLWLLPIVLIVPGLVIYLCIHKPVKTPPAEVQTIQFPQDSLVSDSSETPSVIPKTEEESMSEPETSEPESITEPVSEEPTESAPEPSESESAPEPESSTEENPNGEILLTDAEVAAQRVVYAEGFYYEPISAAVKERIYGKSYKEDCTVPYADLRYMQVLYVDFNNETQTGELVCNQLLAQDFVEIFEELYRNSYQIEKIRLVDEYDADDRASMTDNNTSVFNFRLVSGTKHLSKHAYGAAIDINPFYNPYCEPDGYVSPPGSEIYADRSADFPHKIDENDLCYKLFTEHGFVWGGVWKNTTDYQHFQKALPGY